MDRSSPAATGRAPVSSRPRATVGVIDLGSNTARCVVFETTEGTARAVFETKDAPRLGLAPGPEGRLSDEAIARGLASLRRFAGVLEALAPSRVVAVATSAVRDAPNGAEFLKSVERATGISLRVISGAEEARYAYLGVAGAWALADDLVFDLGGGSLQLAEVRGGTLRNSVSLPLGVLRLSQRFFEHDPPKRHETEELRAHVRETLATVVEAFGGSSYRLFGSGGTIRSLARAAIEMREYPVRRVHGYPLYDHDLEALGELLGEMPAAKRRSVPGIGSDRTDTVPAGVVIIEELLRAGRADRVTVAGTGIRDGIALEAIGAKLPASAQELAERSAVAAAASFAFRLEHGRDVAETAIGLFEVLAKSFDGGPSEALALRVAAWMHDAGTAVDLWNHAHHSAYLVQNYPIRGLDPREILLASMTVYLHEGDDPPSSWKKGYLPILKPTDLATAVRLGTILEVAEILSPGRPRFALGSGGRVLGVSFSASVDTALPPRWAEKVGKSVQRSFGLDVRVRDAG